MVSRRTKSRQEGNTMKQLLSIILSLLIIAAVLAGCGGKVVGSGTTETTVKSEPATTAKDTETVSYQAKSTDKLLDVKDVPAQDLDAADAEYQEKKPVKGEEVAIVHTNYGDISVKLFPEVAPKSVTNFIALADAGRYDDTIFHRITKLEKSGFAVVQGGDYTNFNGTGGVSAYGEGFGLEVSDYLRNLKGSLAMARSNSPDSNGSQFYFNASENGAFDGNYTVFGQIYEGMDVLEAISKVDTDSNDRPVDDVIVKNIEIVTYGE